MRSVMKHSFSQVPRADIQRSSFDRSHGYKTAFDAGYLVPFFVDEALPGDTFNVRVNAFARLATPIYPIMDNMFMDTFFFFVPYRLVWENWQRFMGERDPDPDSSIDYTVPVCDRNPVAEGSLFDYMGIPTGAFSHTFSALPARAYNLIFNEWFRDENLQDSLQVDRDDGPDNDAGVYALRRRGKRHDYFTSALPWPQKGDSVDLPLGTSAPVASPVDTGTVTVKNTSDVDRYLDASAATLTMAATGPGDDTRALYADLTDATAATINQLRQAFQVQRLLERDARGGTRYTEIVRAHFGVTSPDARLQRPEYLGGGSSMVNISPIAQTSESGTTPQGNLSAMGTVSVNGHGFSKSFTEHGVIIGLVNVRADLTYQQGQNRMWSRSTRYDYFWPALAHLGEQAVLNKEIYADGTSADDDVFGYQERYAEYRYKPSLVTGIMRSNATGTLDAWHLSQDFSALPVLGDTFIQDDPPIDRCIAVPAEPHFIFDSFISMRCARPMPMFGVPGMMDHF